jgi:integrase
VASEPTLRPTTSVSYELMTRQHIVPQLGEVLLRELAPAHIRTWHRTLLDKPKALGSGTLSATTVLYTHRMLRRALQDAPRWELILRNPCDAVIPRAASLEMRVWTTEEVRRLLDPEGASRPAP